jgi:hypothetical protein
VIAGQFDDPYQLRREGIFDLVNLATSDLGGIAGARRRRQGRVHGLQRVLDRTRVPTPRSSRNGIPHNGSLQADSTDSLLRIWTSISRQAVQTVDATNIITGVRVRRLGAGRPQRAAAVQRRPRRTQSQTPYLHSRRSPTCPTSAPNILFPVLVRDAEALGIYKALGVPDSAVERLRDRASTSSRRSTWAGRSRCRWLDRRRHHP